MKSDHTAILTVHGLGSYKEKQRRRLTEWLRDKANEIESSELADWSRTRCTFRLMK